ncbi:MAG: hypothetical protein ACU0B9_11085 [Limimaricola soesokkakensis]|uniref:hypothetical protein n=1 Tax=Limimaricola soesokkakensis TaxID=1343159 RepID=UPI00405995BA
MEARAIAALLLLPIVVVLIYAGIHEYRRYKSEGRASYGLAYDKETGTTYVTGISENEDAYDPNGFDPSDHNERQSRKETNDEDG